MVMLSAALYCRETDVNLKYTESLESRTNE